MDLERLEHVAPRRRRQLERQAVRGAGDGARPADEPPALLPGDVVAGRPANGRLVESMTTSRIVGCSVLDGGRGSRGRGAFSSESLLHAAINASAAVTVSE